MRYAALRSLQNSFLAKALEESTHQVVHLVPYAESSILALNF